MGHFVAQGISEHLVRKLVTSVNDMTVKTRPIKVDLRKMMDFRTASQVLKREEKQGYQSNDQGKCSCLEQERSYIKRVCTVCSMQYAVGEYAV